MLKKTLIAVVIVLVLTAFCLADNLLTGHWTGKIMDQYDVAFDFKADSTTLTGTVTGPDGNSSPISNGVIKVDSIFFKMPSQAGGDAIPVKGKLKADMLSIAFTTQGFDITCDLKKTAK
jgi:hypothetical protein